MNIRAMGVSKLLARGLPAYVIKICEVRLVLGVEDVNRSAAADDDIGHEVPKRSQPWLRPVNWDGGLSQPAYHYLATRLGHVPSNYGLDISFPELLKR
jgi:hypothetical protein